MIGLLSFACAELFGNGILKKLEEILLESRVGLKNWVLNDSLYSSELITSVALEGLILCVIMLGLGLLFYMVKGLNRTTTPQLQSHFE